MSSPDPTITLLGDLMLGGEFSAAADRSIDEAISDEVASWLASDLVVANLEAGFSDQGDPTPDKILVHALPEAAPMITRLGLDAVNLANNHILDYGLPALRYTQAVLDDLGVGYFGAGADLAEASRPLIARLDERTVALLGFSWTDEWVQPAPAAGDDTPGVNPLRLDHVLDSIDRVRADADHVVVSLHWGEGMSRWPRPDAVHQARLMLERGADVVMGHHPHCLQPHVVDENGVVLFSLGNFLASPYVKTDESRLTYEDGTVRGRTSRERLTVAARVTLETSPKFDYLPLVQDRDRPALRPPTTHERHVIDRVFRDRGPSVARRGYAGRYWYRRRIDEIVQKFEQVREEGWGAFSWRTPFRALRRLITGRNMH